MLETDSCTHFGNTKKTLKREKQKLLACIFLAYLLEIKVSIDNTKQPNQQCLNNIEIFTVTSQ